MGSEYALSEGLTAPCKRRRVWISSRHSSRHHGGGAVSTEVAYREAPGFPGYRVGSDGSFWTNRKPGPDGKRYTDWRPKSTRPRRDGYVWVNLVRNGHGFGRALHRLILEAFVGPPPAGMVACHGNGRRGDNRLENLRWDSPVNNLADRKAHRTLPSQAGEANNQAKLTVSDVRRIRRLRTRGMARRLIAARYRIHPVTVSFICLGKRWAHVL